MDMEHPTPNLEPENSNIEPLDMGPATGGEGGLPEELFLRETQSFDTPDLLQETHSFSTQDLLARAEPPAPREEEPQPPKAPPQKKRKKRRRSGGRTVAALLLYVVLVIALSLGIATVGWKCAEDVLALNKDYRSATVTLPKDYFTEKKVMAEEKNAAGKTVKVEKTVTEADMDKVAGRLKDAGLIQYQFVFKIFSSFTGAGAKVMPGTYELNTSMDYRALISSMSAKSSSRSVISVTIPEGYTVQQIFALLEEKGVATVKALNDMAAQHDYQFEFLEGVPLGDPNRLEGYLFPDTYQFYIGENPLYVINKMLVNFSDMVSRDTRDKLKANGKSLQDILTVASLIEKETDGTDQALIASVIYNRLNHPEAYTAGYLQIDATLVYINGGKVPTEGDKAIDSPYNTYLYRGLPAGPICNPGAEAIWAAMNPQKSDYYFYALGADGLHHYSKTYNEHQKFLASLPKE